jgi:gas vesicle protein
MKKNFVLLGIVAMVFSLAMLAQPREGKQPNRHADPEMKTYVAENILPMIKAQRQQFDEKLTDEEKSELDRLRAEILEIRKERREKRQTAGNLGQRMNAGQKQEMRRLRDQIEEKIEKVEVIAEKHENELIPVLADLRNEIRQKMESQCPRQPGCDPQRKMERRNKGNNPETGRRGFGMREHDGFHFERILTPVGFLLFDHERNPSDMEAMNPDGELMRLNLFPNPASGSVQVSALLDKPAELKILLVNSDGNVIRELKEQVETSGVYTTEITLDNLNDGFYFIKVAAGDKTATRRLIVKK